MLRSWQQAVSSINTRNKHHTTRCRDCIDPSGFLLNDHSAIGGGVSAGLAGGVIPSTNNVIGDAVIRGAVANSPTQGISVVTGLQSSFSWRSVAAATVGAGIGQAVAGPVSDAIGGSPLGDFAARAVTGLVAGAAVAAARGGRVAIQQVATDAFGVALGSSIAAANGQKTQGDGPWSDADYRNGSDIQSDSAALQRQSQPYLDQIVGAFGQNGGSPYAGVQLARRVSALARSG